MSDRETTTTIPRWVKVFGLAGIVLVLLFIILHLTGNSPFSGPGAHTPPIEHGMSNP